MSYHKTMSNFEQTIVNKFKCLYCFELCKWNKVHTGLDCDKHPVNIEYGFKGEYDSSGYTIDDSYKLEFFAFRSKFTCNNFRAVFMVRDNKFFLQQQLGNEQEMKKILKFDFFPELTPETISDKIKNYLVFS